MDLIVLIIEVHFLIFRKIYKKLWKISRNQKFSYSVLKHIIKKIDQFDASKIEIKSLHLITQRLNYELYTDIYHDLLIRLSRSLVLNLMINQINQNR